MPKSKRIGSINFGVTMSTRRLRRSISRARVMIRGFVGQTTRMMGVLVGPAGVAFGLIKTGAAFETLSRSMNRSMSIMGNVSSAMRSDMRDAAIEVSRTTNASARDAADAYFFLASAGLNAAQSLRALPKVAKFAQAGNFDLARATDLLTDAQSALGLSTEDMSQNMENMQRVSDVLVKGNTLANATVEQFSEALTNKAGAALRLLGKDVEEGVAVLAAFADQGIKGAEAGTGFGIVLRDLQTKAIKFSSVFRKAGITVFDSSGDMRNMADIMEDLETRMTGMSDQAKKTFLLGLGFSDKSVSFVQSLIGVSDKIRDYEKALRSAGGTTASVAGKMLTPLEKAINELSGSFQKAAEGMSPLVSMLAEMTKSLAEIIKGHALIGLKSDWSGQGGRNLVPSARIADIGPTGFPSQRPGSSTGMQGPFESAYNAVRELLDDDITRAFNSSGPALPRKRIAGLLGRGMGKARTVGNFIANRFEEDKEKASRIKQEKMAASSFGVALTQALGKAMKFDLAASTAVARWNLTEREKVKKTVSSPLGGLSFGEAGSAEGHLQRARIRRATESQKLDKERNEKLSLMVNLLLNPVKIAAANL